MTLHYELALGVTDTNELIQRGGDHYFIKHRRWWITSVTRPNGHGVVGTAQTVRNLPSSGFIALNVHQDGRIA